MSADKSKAVQIAEKLSHDLPTILRIDAEAAGDELRRIEAVNRELLEALQGMASVWVSTCSSNGWSPEHMSQYTAARAAIAKATDV